MSTSGIVILVTVILVYFWWALFNGFLAKLRNHSFATWFGVSLCIMTAFATPAEIVSTLYLFFIMPHISHSKNEYLCGWN